MLRSSSFVTDGMILGMRYLALALLLTYAAFAPTTQDELVEAVKSSEPTEAQVKALVQAARTAKSYDTIDYRYGGPETKRVRPIEKLKALSKKEFYPQRGNVIKGLIALSENGGSPIIRTEEDREDNLRIRTEAFLIALASGSFEAVDKLNSDHFRKNLVDLAKVVEFAKTTPSANDAIFALQDLIKDKYWGKPKCPVGVLVGK